MKSPTLPAHLALLLAMAIWGSSFIALKSAILVLNPLQVIFLRMLAGSCVFLLLMPWWRKSFVYHAGDWKWLLGMVAFEPCLYFVFEGLALQYTSASQAGLVTSMLPLMIAAGAWLFLKEKIHNAQWIGFSLAVSGVIWMSWHSDVSEQATNPLLGNFLEFMAMLTAVGYTLLVKKMTARYSPLFLTALQSFSGAIFFLPLALTQPIPEILPLPVVLNILYLGVIVSLCGYGLYNFALSRLPATTTGAYINLIPVFALLLALLLLQEQMNLSQWLAVLVIFTGVGISQYSGKPRLLRPETPPS